MKFPILPSQVFAASTTKPIGSIDAGGPWSRCARFVGRVRSTNHRSTTQYLRLIEQGHCPSHERDVLSDEQILRDQFVFGMRRLEGIAWPDFREQFSAPLENPLNARSIR